MFGLNHGFDDVVHSVGWRPAEHVSCSGRIAEPSGEIRRAPKRLGKIGMLSPV